MLKKEKINQRIEELAEKVAQICDTPVPGKEIEKVITSLGGKLVFDKTLSEFHRGYIVPHQSGFTITMSANQNKERMNFNIARCLGELFLEMGYMIDEKTWNETCSEEHHTYDIETYFRENKFAAAFLMPKYAFKKSLNNNISDGKINLKNIAEEFAVKMDDVEFRAKLLGYSIL